MQFLGWWSFCSRFCPSNICVYMDGLYKFKYISCSFAQKTSGTGIDIYKETSDADMDSARTIQGKWWRYGLRKKWGIWIGKANNYFDPSIVIFTLLIYIIHGPTSSGVFTELVAARHDHMILLWNHDNWWHKRWLLNYRMKDAGIRCPTVHHVKLDVVVMDFIGMYDVYF